MINEVFDTGYINVNQTVQKVINEEVALLSNKINDVKVKNNENIQQIRSEVNYLQGRITHNEEYIKKLTSYIKMPWWKRIFKKIDI